MKLGFIGFSYWKIDLNTFIQNSLDQFDEVVFFDLRNLFPALIPDPINAPFSEEKLPSKPLQFQTLNAFESYLQKETIVILNGFGEQKFAMWKLSYLLRKHRIPMIGIQKNSGLINVLKKQTQQPSIKPNRIEIVEKKLFFFIYLLLLRWNILSRYDTYFISGKKVQSTITKYKVKYNEIIPVHSDVYDNFLIHKTQHHSHQNSTIVFLDIAMPFMIDFKQRGFEPIDPDHYYKNLNRFFDLIESITGQTVTVCAHPQFNADKKEHYFPTRNVVWFQSQEYVSRSTMVLVHYTNAIQHAILYDKPILLLDDLSLNPYIRTSIEYCKTSLDLSCVHYATITKQALEDQLERLNVNQTKYNQFKYDYLVNEEDENRISTDKIVHTLKEKYGSCEQTTVR